MSAAQARNFLISCFLLLATSCRTYAGDQEVITKLLLSFHEMDTQTFFLCRTTKSGPSESRDMRAMEQAYAKFFVRDLAQLYAMAKCDSRLDVSGIDPRYGDIDLWDKLYGPRAVTNLKVQQLSVKGDSATARIVYDYDRPEMAGWHLTYKEYGNFIQYKLIAEDSQWKIDDLQIGGGVDRENTGFFVYKSLRKELRRELARTKKKLN